MTKIPKPKKVIKVRIALIMPGRAQIQLKTPKQVKPWLPPGALFEVAGMTPEEHEVVIWDELAQGLISEETLPEADLYGLSGLSTSRYGAYRVADLIRNQGKKVIAGGMDVTGHYSEGYQQELLNHYDSIVVGRLTTKLWTKILEDFTKDKLEPVYRTDPEEPWEFAFPRHELIVPENYFAPAVIRTSAGCNETCPFCTVHLVLGGRRIVYCKPAKILKKELKILPESKYLVDASDSFGTDYNHTIYVALPFLRDSGRPWFAEITIKNLLGQGEGRKELITPMAENGCAVIYIGIESIFSPVSGKSLSRALTEEAIKRAHDSGLIVLGSIILDITGKETEDSIKETVEWVIAQKLDFLQYSLLALLPASNSRKLALQQGKIIDNNPEHLDGAWPTIEHQIPPEKRIELLQWAYRQTYSFPNIIRKLRHVRPGWRLTTTAANYLIHRSARNWEKSANYEYWLKTREDAPA